MADGDPAGTPGGPRRQLSERGILEEALLLIEADGLASLTMRRLGDRLGVEAMTLYHYVRSRDAVIDGVVELIVDELYSDPQVRLVPTDGWQDYLRRLAWGVRRFAVAHPRSFPIVATRPPAAPWVRPPLRSLRWIEAFLEAFRGEGFSDAAILYVYRAFTSYLLGHLLLETGAMTAAAPAAGDGSFNAANPETAADSHAEAEPDSRTPVVGQVSPTRTASVVPSRAAAGLDPQRYPLIVELADALGESHAEQEFTDSLDALIERVAALAEAPLSRPSG